MGDIKCNLQKRRENTQIHISNSHFILEINICTHTNTLYFVYLVDWGHKSERNVLASSPSASATFNDPNPSNPAKMV